MSISLKELLPTIEKRYGSLEQPIFSFVEKQRSKNPYQKLEILLRENFDVEDVTDMNYDVSFCYEIDKKWLLQLSMVGSYAVILSLGNGIHIVKSNTANECEQKMFKLLIEHGFMVLDREGLELPVSLKLFNTDPENCCIYQALFSDIDILPWKAQKTE